MFFSGSLVELDKLTGVTTVLADLGHFPAVSGVSVNMEENSFVLLNAHFWNNSLLVDSEFNTTELPKRDPGKVPSAVEEIWWYNNATFTTFEQLEFGQWYLEPILSGAVSSDPTKRLFWQVSVKNEFESLTK